MNVDRATQVLQRRNINVQVRELKIRDSEAVVRWGALLLSKHAATLSFEERESPSLLLRPLPLLPHTHTTN